ncbi:LacI family DNA-binding transcriptional regulator [Neptunicella sp. SCSIO 80796]|uniref:LacI family DNA-binding transcriptional regulator n=1 Tax=Neptunicella plasticusilytica TaxID=3117012 RepID=UPI003A4E3EC3
MATIYQVSELAGVSLATVSRVINGVTPVSEKTREKVLEAMDKLNYRPNSIAQSLASNKTDTIGYVVPELHGSFFGSMMSGSDKVLRSSGKHMFIAPGHSNEKDEKEAIEILIGRRCDALILHLEAISDDYLIELAKENIPFVVVNRYIEAISEHCISMDNKLGGYLATQALVKQGHNQVAYIAGSLWKADARERLEGHKQALREAGIDFDETLMYEGDFQGHAGEEGIKALFSQGKQFTAVACANDEMASGAINAIREQDLLIPEDISVVGFDNVEYSNYLTPKLTTIHYPMEDIGKMAASWILNKVYGNRTMELTHIVLPKLIERHSVAAPKV